MDENTMDKQSSPKSSLFDGWNAPPNLVTYSRIVLVVIFLTLDILAGAWGENNLTMRWVAAARQAQDRIPVRGSVHAAAAVLVSG